MERKIRYTTMASVRQEATVAEPRVAPRYYTRSNWILTEINYSREIFNEAHLFGDRETLTSSACINVRAEFRLALTAARVQNGFADLWTYFAIIGVPVFDTYS